MVAKLATALRLLHLPQCLDRWSGQEAAHLFHCLSNSQTQHTVITSWLLQLLPGLVQFRCGHNNSILGRSCNAATLIASVIELRHRYNSTVRVPTNCCHLISQQVCTLFATWHLYTKSQSLHRRSFLAVGDLCHSMSHKECEHLFQRFLLYGVHLSDRDSRQT